MAALATQNVSAGAAVSLTAAAGGGDTAECGAQSGGWGSGAFLMGTVGATPTTVTVLGVAYGPFTSTSFFVPLANTYAGSRLAVTYSSVTGLTVAVVRGGPVLNGITWGT